MTGVQTCALPIFGALGLRRALLQQLGLDLLGDNAGHVLGRGGRAQRAGELRLHQAAGELGQELEVEVVGAGGCGDHEDEVRALAVGRPEVDAPGQAREAEGGRQDVGAAAVRDGDAPGDAGGGGGLTGAGVGGQALGGGGTAGGGDDLGEVADDLRLGGARRHVEPDELRDDERNARCG